ncbi:hypothetical protein GCM10020256_73000 [Streptomyces thermocoprophilus]
MTKDPRTAVRDGAGTTLAAVAVVQFMVSLDLSVVNVGLPEIAAGLGFGAVGLTWVIHAYALTFGGLLLLGGKAADRHGHKRVLLLGLGLFGLASFAGGFAQEPGHLVAARAAQGIGAAALAPGGAGPAGRDVPRRPGPRAGVRRVERHERRRWRLRCPGGRSAHRVRGMALGDVRERADGAVRAGPRTARSRRRPAGGPRRRPDIAGAVLATVGMTLLVFGVVRTDQYGWTSPATMTTLSVAALLLGAFVHVERTTAREPLVRPGLIARRAVAGANLCNLLLGAAMAAAFYFVSLYVQRVLGKGRR